MPQRQVSTMHSISTFTVSRERQKPASSMVKPTCMPKTRKAANNVQRVLIGFTISEAFTPLSAANTRVPSSPELKATSSRTRPRPMALPPHSSNPYRRHSEFRNRHDSRDIFPDRDSFARGVDVEHIVTSLLRTSSSYETNVA